jgi:5-methylcytosine-specific restriction endonuclease McrA
LAATGEGIAREKESARATRERISREDERFPDKNSWVHYFGKCQVKNAKHLEMDLFFPLAKRLETWQILTNDEF